MTGRSTRMPGQPVATALLLTVWVALCPPAVAQASGAQLAADKGCYNCHGEPPRKKTPTFAALAKDYAQYRGQPDKESALAEKLRAGSFLSHIDAHERLSAEDARALVHWIISGSPRP